MHEPTRRFRKNMNLCCQLCTSCIEDCGHALWTHEKGDDGRNMSMKKAPVASRGSFVEQPERGSITEGENFRSYDSDANTSLSHTPSTSRRVTLLNGRDRRASAKGVGLDSVRNASRKASTAPPTDRRVSRMPADRRTSRRSTGENLTQEELEAEDLAFEREREEVFARAVRLAEAEVARAKWEARALAFLAEGNAVCADGTPVARWIMLQQALKDAKELGKPLSNLCVKPPAHCARAVCIRRSW